MNKTSQALLYGRGVFTSVAVYAGQPFLWEKHWQRLTENAQRIGIDLSAYNEQKLRVLVLDAIALGKIIEGRLRITFYYNGSSEIWPKEKSGENTTMSIIVGDRRPVPRPFRCFVSPHIVNSRSPLIGIKSCNYLENTLALEDARRRGFEEAIRLNEHGAVTSACMANVFWLKDEGLFTPSLSTGCLPGTTREYVLQNLKCEEVEAGIAEFESADALFLTSAGLAVAAVDEFNGRTFSVNDHPILRLIAEGC